MSKNCQKHDFCFFLNCQKLSFFQKKLPMAIFLKKWQFLVIKKKDNFWLVLFLNVKFWAIFWHSDGNFPEGQVVIFWVHYWRLANLHSDFHARLTFVMGIPDLRITPLYRSTLYSYCLVVSLSPLYTHQAESFNNIPR